MRTVKQTLYYPSRDAVYTIYHLTDLHVGAAACDEVLLRADVSRIAADPNAYWIGGGDYIDCIARKGDRRYQETALASWLRGKDDVIGQQRDYVVDLLKPIANKCLGMLVGNHEYAALRYYDRDVYRELVRGVAQMAGVPPETLMLGVQGFVQVTFRRGAEASWGNAWRLTIYCHHGYGGGRMPGGHALTLGRVLGDYDCDLALLGHRHVRQFVDKVVVGANGKARTRLAMFVPGYLSAYVRAPGASGPVDTYVEHFGLPPQHLGTVPIRVVPYQRRIQVVLEVNHQVAQEENAHEQR